jgi:hypothetical protein
LRLSTWIEPKGRAQNAATVQKHSTEKLSPEEGAMATANEFEWV